MKNIVNTKEYDFLRENKRLNGNIALLAFGGSHSYGTNIEGSDIDIRGIITHTPAEILGNLNGDFEQYTDENTDTVLYTVEKAFALFTNSNPNVIELLGSREQDYIEVNEVGKMILDNKSVFLSQKAIHSFGGYASAQLRRLENALSRDVYEIEEKEKHIKASIERQINSFSDRYKDEFNIKLFVDKSTSKNRSSEIFMDLDLKAYPLRDFHGIYSEMSNVIKDYDKLNHRNNKKDDTHLCKHAMHLYRLYLMGIDIISKGEIKTYRENDIDILMKIRNGKFQNSDSSFNSEFYEMLNKIELEFEYACKNTTLPKQPRYNEIDEILVEINKISLRNII